VVTGLNIGGALGVVFGLKAENGLWTPSPTEPGIFGWNPVAGAADFDGSGAEACVVFGAKRLVDSAGAAGLLLMAFANMFEVAVAGGLNLGAGIEGCGVGVVGASAGRARFVGEASRDSEVSSLTLRFVDNADSLPVTPFAAARCFFAMSIFFLIAELC
jgi:hypothetical protein